MAGSNSSSSPEPASLPGAIGPGQRMEVRWVVVATTGFLCVLAMLPLVGPSGWKVEWSGFNRWSFGIGTLLALAVSVTGALAVRRHLPRPSWVLWTLASIEALLLVAGLTGWVAG